MGEIRVLQRSAASCQLGPTAQEVANVARQSLALLRDASIAAHSAVFRLGICDLYMSAVVTQFPRSVGGPWSAGAPR